MPQHIPDHLYHHGLLIQQLEAIFDDLGQTPIPENINQLEKKIIFSKMIRIT